MDKVSIVVPIYNVEKYLDRCVESLINQQYNNIEILLVDDCSTDGSADIAKRYADKHPEKCIFIQREKNGGLAAARNSALKQFTGEWVTFVDSDDWVDPEYIDVLYNTAVSENADIVMSQFNYSYPSGVLEKVSPFGALTSESSHKEIVAFSDSCSCTRLFRRELFTENGIDFPEDIWRSEDISTIIPLLTKTDKIALVPKAMYYYFQRSTSLSNQNFNGVDVSFFPKTIKRMIRLSNTGFERELEFRAVNELMYGMVMVMMRSGRKRDDFKKHTKWFNAEFPAWRSNPYLSQIAAAKRIFINCAAKNYYLLLKLLILAWDLKQKFQNKQKG